MTRALLCHMGPVGASGQGPGHQRAGRTSGRAPRLLRPSRPGDGGGAGSSEGGGAGSSDDVLLGPRQPHWSCAGCGRAGDWEAS